MLTGRITNITQVITKNRMFNNAGRLKVNMGNIYFKLGQYHKAIKFYRMALDQVHSIFRYGFYLTHDKRLWSYSIDNRSGFVKGQTFIGDHVH